MRLGLDLITRNWTLKLAALGLAVLLWSITRGDSTTRVPLADVPVEVALRDPGWSLAAPPTPRTVTVTFVGPARELLPLIAERPRIVVPIEEVEDTVEVRRMQPGWIRLRGGTGRARIEEIRPATVRLRFQPVATQFLPVAVRTVGSPPADYRLTGPPTAEPAAVRVSGPRSIVSARDSIPLRAVDLTDVRDTLRLTVGVDTAAVEGLALTPFEVDVTIPVAARADTVAPPDTAPADTVTPGETPAAGTAAAAASGGPGGGR